MVYRSLLKGSLVVGHVWMHEGVTYPEDIFGDVEKAVLAGLVIEGKVWTDSPESFSAENTIGDVAHENVQTCVSTDEAQGAILQEQDAVEQQEKYSESTSSVELEKPVPVKASSKTSRKKK